MEKESLKIVVIGMGKYTIGCLNAILEKEYNVVGIIQSVRKKQEYSLWDRLTIEKGSLKRFAYTYKIPYMYTDNLNDNKCIDFLKSVDCNLICVASAGQLLKGEIINFPSNGVMNAHSSLLPEYRGANPSYWVIRNQEKAGGVTIHYIDDGMDSGDVLIQKKFEIPYKYSYKEYDDKIAKIAGECYLEVLDLLCGDNLCPQKQIKDDGFIAKRIQDKDYNIDYNLYSRKEVFHYLFGTDALNHINKSILFQYEAIDPCDEIKGKYSIQCKDGLVYYNRFFSLNLFIRKMAGLLLGKIRIKAI